MCNPEVCYQKLGSKKEQYGVLVLFRQIFQESFLKITSYIKLGSGHMGGEDNGLGKGTRKAPCMFLWGSMLAWRQADPLSPRKGTAFVLHCQRAAHPRPAHHRLPSAVCVPRGKMNIALGHT